MGKDTLTMLGTLIVLLRLRGKTEGQLAEFLGIPPSTLSKRLRSGGPFSALEKGRIVRFLGADDFDSSVLFANVEFPIAGGSRCRLSPEQAEAREKAAQIDELQKRIDRNADAMHGTSDDKE